MQLAFFLHFLHRDANSAKEKVSQRVGSCIFIGIFMLASKAPEAFFFLKKMQHEGFIREFLWKFHFFCIFFTLHY